MKVWNEGATPALDALKVESSIASFGIDGNGEFLYPMQGLCSLPYMEATFNSSHIEAEDSMRSKSVR